MFAVPFALAWDFSGYGPSEDHSKAISAKVARFGEVGVFTYKKLIYRPATGWRAFPNGGIPKYLTDEEYIGLYDFKTKEARVIRKEDNINGYWTDGQGEFFVTDTYGEKVLVSRGGQRRSDLKFEYNLYWLDLDMGELTPVLLKEELARQGLELGYFYLIDEEGTLLLIVPPVGSGPGWQRNDKIHPILLIRSPDGKYEKIAEILHFYGLKGDEVHYWSSNEGYRVYNRQTKAVREGARAEYREIAGWSPKKDLGINVDLRPGPGQDELQSCRQQEGELVCVAVDLSGVK